MKAKNKLSAYVIYKNTWSSLTSSEKLMLFSTLIIRVSLAALDLIGIALVGATAAMITDSRNYKNFIPSFAEFWFEGVPAKYVLVSLAVAAVSFFLVKSVLAFFLNQHSALFMARLESKKSGQALRKIMRGGIEPVEKWTANEITYGLTGSIRASYTGIYGSTMSLLVELFLVISISVYLALANLALLTALGTFFAFLLFTINLTSGALSARFAMASNVNSIQAGNLVVELISNFRQARTSGFSTKAVDKFTSLRSTSTSANAKLEILSGSQRYIVESALILALGTTIVLDQLFEAPLISTEIIAVFIAGAFRVLGSIVPIQTQINNLVQARVDAAYFQSIQNEYAEVPDSKKSETRSVDKKLLVKVENLTYVYPGSRTPAISNFTFVLNKPGIYVLSGQSGAGKSTFADLLMGLRKPTSGTIQINGISAEEFVGMFPGEIAYVPQKTSLIQGSLLDNITYFDDKPIDLSLLNQAIQGASLVDLVSKLPNGMDSIVQESNSKLSGGQIQRIGVARSLYLKPRILVLDEATNAVDGETEVAILRQLKKLSKKLIVIIISHGQKSIGIADYVINVPDEKRRR